MEKLTLKNANINENMKLIIKIRFLGHIYFRKIIPVKRQRMYTSVHRKSIHLHFVCVNQIYYYPMSLSVSVAGN
jgi:hypothetical protein